MAKVFNIGGNTISYGGFLLRELGSGSLTISKTVSGSGFDPTKTFELMVVFSVPITYNGTTSTTHTFNLAHGQSVTISNIPELTTYEVTETPLSQQDIEAGYSIIGITDRSGKIGNASAITAVAENYHSLLSAKHIRIEFNDPNYDPTQYNWKSSVTWTRVSTTPNVWDCENTDSVWRPANFGTNWPSFSGTSYKVLSMNAEGVTDTSYMFGYSEITSISDVSRTDSVASMDYMFTTCRSLTSVDLFDIRNVTSMDKMFEFCSSLQTIPQFDTSNVTSMEYTFAGCSSLTSVPLLDTSSVDTMNGAFWMCTSLQTIPQFDTSGVTDMDDMFMGCSSLTSVPLLDTGNVTSMVRMFTNCTSLQTIPLFDTSSLVSVHQTFMGCVNVRSGALALYNRMSGQPFPPSSHENCFSDCGRNTSTGRAELAQIPVSWGGDRT